VTPLPGNGVGVWVASAGSAGAAMLTPGGNRPRTTRSVGDGVVVTPPGGVNVGRGVFVGVGLLSADRPTIACPTEQLRPAAARNNTAKTKNQNRLDWVFICDW
jgi:hypothetical protein